MNKELTPLEALENIVVDLTPHLKEANKEEITIVETALKDYEDIKPTIDLIDNGKLLMFDEKQYEQINKNNLALEIIKESIPIEEEDFFYDKETDTYLFIGHKVSKEHFYLLKEVLL